MNGDQGVPVLHVIVDEGRSQVYFLIIFAIAIAGLSDLDRRKTIQLLTKKRRGL